jgi:hypothetical protein
LLRHVLAASALSLCLASGPSRADEPAPTPGPRELAGHHFLVSHLIENPFSATSFAQNFGVGFGQALGPSLDLSTSPPSVKQDSKWYTYAGFIEQVDLTVRILDWLSIRGGFAAGLRQGAGNGSALVVGTAVNAAGVFGVKGSLQLSPSIRTSLTADVAYGPTLNLLLLQGIVAGVKAGRFDTQDLVKSRDALTAGLTAGAAWAPTPWLGLLGNLRYVHTRSTTVADSSQDGVQAAASLEFDARPLVAWLPVGTNVSYRYTGPLGGGDGSPATIDEVSLGFFYTGRPHFVVGLEAEGRYGRLDTELQARQALVWINARYFW